MGSSPGPRLTRRTIGVFYGAACSGALAAACGGVGGPVGAGQSGGPKRTTTYTVRVQVWGDIQDQSVYDNIRDDYNAAHTDIKIENDHQPPSGPGVPTYYNKFAANLAAGTVADLAYFQGWMWQEYAGKGALQEVDDRAAKDKWTQPWPSDAAYDLQTRFRGKRFMSPSNIGTMVMYYVKEYFDKTGTPYPRADWTLNDFQETARKLTRQLDGKQVYGYQWNGGYLRNTPWWRMNSVMEWDRIAEPKKANWAAGGVIEAYQYQLYDSQYKLQIAPTQELLSADATYNRIEFGGAAMKVEGPWFLPRMWGPQAKRDGGTQYDVQLLPTGKLGKKLHMNLIEGQAMLKQSKDKDAAWDVMKWIGSDNGQKRIAEGGRMCNVPDTNRRFWLPGVRQKYNVANAEAFLKAIEGATINLVGEITENVINRDAGLATALTGIRDGKVNAKEALEQTQPKIQQLLDSYWASQPSRWSRREPPGGSAHVH